MSEAVTFALFSLLFAGLLDVVFKRYSSKTRSRGMVICGIGVVWLVLQIGFLKLNGVPLSLRGIDIGYGLAAGVMVTLSNIFLMESLTHLQVSLGSTIYRLNTIGVVILSALFLGESLATLKIAGIAVGLVGIFLLYRSDAKMNRAVDGLAVANVFFWVAISASLLRACYGVTTKAGLENGANATTLLLIAAVCWIIGGFAYAALREKRVRITVQKLGYSVIAGILVFLNVNCLIAAMARGEVSIVASIANLSFVIALLISVALKWERLNMSKISAVTCAAGSIFLLAQAA